MNSLYTEAELATRSHIYICHAGIIQKGIISNRRYRIYPNQTRAFSHFSIISTSLYFYYYYFLEGVPAVSNPFHPHFGTAARRRTTQPEQEGPNTLAFNTVRVTYTKILYETVASDFQPARLTHRTST